MSAAPAQKGGGHEISDGTGSTSTVARGTDTAPRAGDTVRVTWARQVRGACLACDAEFRNSGTAASHARSARHAVHVEYASSFAYVPAERLAQTLGAEGV